MSNILDRKRLPKVVPGEVILSDKYNTDIEVLYLAINLVSDSIEIKRVSKVVATYADLATGADLNALGVGVTWQVSDDEVTGEKDVSYTVETDTDGNKYWRLEEVTKDIKQFSIKGNIDSLADRPTPIALGDLYINRVDSKLYQWIGETPNPWRDIGVQTYDDTKVKADIETNKKNLEQLAKLDTDSIKAVSDALVGFKGTTKRLDDKDIELGNKIDDEVDNRVKDVSKIQGTKVGATETNKQDLEQLQPGGTLVNDSIALESDLKKLSLTDKDGNTKTLYQWMVEKATISIAGAKGDKGDVGPQGIQGIQGLTGAKGEPGAGGSFKKEDYFNDNAEFLTNNKKFDDWAYLGNLTSVIGIGGEIDTDNIYLTSKKTYDKAAKFATPEYSRGIFLSVNRLKQLIEWAKTKGFENE